METILREYKATLVNNNHWVIKGEVKEWEIHVYKDAIYPDSESVWDWKVDTQFFSQDNYAEKYLRRLVSEKETGIRIINRSKREVPDICGDGTLGCRHPNQCNTMLCSNCPVAEAFFAKRDGVILQYISEDITK